jgi:predicted PurR-regulated permease PerM
MRTKYDLLLEEKNDLESEFEQNLRNLDETQSKEIQSLENEFQHKMMTEVMIMMMMMMMMMLGCFLLGW